MELYSRVRDIKAMLERHERHLVSLPAKLSVYFARSAWMGLRTSSVCAGTVGKARRSVCSWCNVFFLSSRGLVSQSVLLSLAICLHYHSYGVYFDGACRFIRKGFTTATNILHTFPMGNFIGSQWGASMH